MNDPLDVGLEVQNRKNIDMLKEYYHIDNSKKSAKFKSSKKIQKKAPKLGDKVSMLLNNDTTTLDRFKLARSM